MVDQKKGERRAKRVKQEETTMITTTTTTLVTNVKVKEKRQQERPNPALVQKAQAIVKILNQLYPDPPIPLNHHVTLSLGHLAC